MNYFPLLTSIIAFIFTLLLARQYLERHKIHQIIWTISMLFYGITALIEFLMNPEVLGANIIAFKIYYVLAAPLVGFLGAGVLYLIFRKRVADIFFVLMILLSFGLLFTSILTPLDSNVFFQSFEGELGEAFKSAVYAYPMSVRVFSILLNSVGGIVLIGGALYCFVLDRTKSYNLLLLIGGLLPAIGGLTLGLLGDPNIFFEFELGGVIFLFLGFVYSNKYIKNKSSLKTN